MLLAYVPESVLEEALSTGPRRRARHTRNTIVSKGKLRDELGHVREAGFATDDRERAGGLAGVAVPVRDESGEVVAAIDISLPVQVGTVEELVQAYLVHLQVAAENVSARLGYRRVSEPEP